MTAFSGFPAKARMTPVPTLFLSDLLPQIEDVAELKATLHFLRLLTAKRSYPRFVSHGELAADRAAGSEVKEGLEAAARRGTLLHLVVENNGATEDLYFLNTEADRRAIARIESGEIILGRIVSGPAVPAREARPNIFELYERNIGLLTPIIADELQEAERLYPEAWIEEAFREAVERNKRNWRYIARILERWATEGRNGEPGRDLKERQYSEGYLKGKYSHLIKH
ncbi:MAG: DnaD domain protein [Chloroflexota bacterium]